MEGFFATGYALPLDTTRSEMGGKAERSTATNGASKPIENDGGVGSAKGCRRLFFHISTVVMFEKFRTLWKISLRFEHFWVKGRLVDTGSPARTTMCALWSDSQALGRFFSAGVDRTISLA